MCGFNFPKSGGNSSNNLNTQQHMNKKYKRLHNFETKNSVVTYQFRIRRFHLRAIFADVFYGTVCAGQILAVVIASQRQLYHRTDTSVVQMCIVPWRFNVGPFPTSMINTLDDGNREFLDCIVFCFRMSWVTISAKLYNKLCMH